MSNGIDFAYKSINHYGEELCGDVVNVVRYGDKFMGVLADGMGSGVKANILATMTSKIFTTMLSSGELVESAVETVVNSLPLCSERQLNYSTFSIVRINGGSHALMVEFDNPAAFIIRENAVVTPEYVYRAYADKSVFESELQLVEGDVVCIVSDGVINAGMGANLDTSWTWDGVASWLCTNVRKYASAKRLANAMLEAVDNLYAGKPSDDSTVMIVKIPETKHVSLMYGPPSSKELDLKMVREFMDSHGTKIICGGTSSNIVSRVLGKEIETQLQTDDSHIPPISFMEDVDLVTEGIITVTKANEIINDYFSAGYGTADFKLLDAENGASILAKLLIEECSHLKVFIGTARNPAHEEENLPLGMTAKMKAIESICDIMQKYGRTVEKRYY